MNNKEEHTLPELINLYISEDEFAFDELKRGKKLHKSENFWWIERYKFYFVPLNKMRIVNSDERLLPFKIAPLGYSFRTNNFNRKGFDLIFNVLEGENLLNYDINKITKSRNVLKQGLKNCEVKVVQDIRPYLKDMKAININQALRFDKMGAKKDYLSASYYNEKEKKWVQDMLDNFEHVGHFLVGAFVDNQLAAYIDLTIIENLWEFGAVKSHDDFLQYRPVDALYFNVIRSASLNPYCDCVINGGGINERESLTKFKSRFLLQPTAVNFRTNSFVPIKIMNFMKKVLK